MGLRTTVQRRMVDLWQSRGLGARLLWPLAVLHGVLRAVARWRWRHGWMRQQRLPVPVLVVGNLYVGGTGKTPLTIALARGLKARGWHPAIVSRGYGGAAHVPREVDPNGSAAEYGDEPLLMAQRAGVPIVVGSNRAAAGALALNLHPRTDLLIADDGLQHQRLARDLELALVHYRGLGNGWLLPAGPLRDPPTRLAEVDAVVFNDQLDVPRPPVRVYSPFFGMRTQLGPLRALKDPTRVSTLAELVTEQQRGQLRVLAMCGIGMPDRFFGMLRAAGLVIEELALHDHYPYLDNPLAAHRFDICLITEKDAVKCTANPALASDGRLCVATLDAAVDDALLDFVEQRLRQPAAAPAKEPDGYAPA
jgi:tetraacyldisaccharide 4'-kinase